MFYTHVKYHFVCRKLVATYTRLFEGTLGGLGGLLAGLAGGGGVGRVMAWLANGVVGV